MMAKSVLIFPLYAEYPGLFTIKRQIFLNLGLYEPMYHAQGIPRQDQLDLFLAEAAAFK